MAAITEGVDCDVVDVDVGRRQETARRDSGSNGLNSNPGNNLVDFSVQCLKRVIRRHAKNISGVTNLLVMTQMRTILEVE